MLILLTLLGIFGQSPIAGVEANVSLTYKAVKFPRHTNPANCSIGNTTFAHGVTFKLDCKTQCVCENGRHACSSLCPNEQLPAPEDTISCRSPRLVEVPGHCCKMWLCENPTADVYATCRNSTSSNWTACSRACGLGFATRYTSTHAGCHQLSNLRLCENRRCNTDNKTFNKNKFGENKKKPLDGKDHFMIFTKQLTKTRHNAPSQILLGSQHYHARPHPDHHYHHQQHPNSKRHQQTQQDRPTHRIRKGHECRSIQRLGPARIRLGECVSRKLYRPKLCGRCHCGLKCCAPAVSTTIQVELLCPLNTVDPMKYIQQRTQLQQQLKKQQQSAEEEEDDWIDSELWNTLALEPIDQEFLQSHQIQIENKFIAVEWILKCECNKNNCYRNNNGSRSSTNKYESYNEYDDIKRNQINIHRPSETKNGELNGEPILKSIDTTLSGNDENSSSEQQPDIIPYPLSIGETSWKTTKLQHKQSQQQQQRWQYENT